MLSTVVCAIFIEELFNRVEVSERVLTLGGKSVVGMLYAEGAMFALLARSNLHIEGASSEASRSRAEALSMSAKTLGTRLSTEYRENLHVITQRFRLYTEVLNFFKKRITNHEAFDKTEE